MVLPTTAHQRAADHAAAMVAIYSAEEHGLLSGPAAAYLRAGVYAAVEDAVSQRCERTRIYRKHALRVLAESRADWEPDDDGTPVTDGAVGQVAAFIAGLGFGFLPNTDSANAWRLLCESVDMIAGLDGGTVDPADHFDPGTPGSVEAKRDILRNDAESDAGRALAGLLRTRKAAA
jgi:hypothetical protein